jgi:hemerythrin-like domain-containing protein
MGHGESKSQNRRELFRALGTSSLGIIAGANLLGCSSLHAASDTQAGEAFMSPNEDLMQEHALLNRVLLIYDFYLHRLSAKQVVEAEPLQQAAQIIQRFVESYHEKLEEEHVFPRFERAGKLVNLVKVLREQHQAGRNLTTSVLSMATPSGIKGQGAAISTALSKFIRMYRPHECREGSVLFPAFRELVPAKEFGELGEMFEKKEHEVLGSEGFEGQVEIVAGIEKRLGLYELAQFTPK